MTDQPNKVATRFTEICRAMEKQYPDGRVRVELLRACEYAADQVATPLMFKAIKTSITVRCLDALLRHPLLKTPDEYATVIADASEESGEELMKAIAKMNNISIHDLRAEANASKQENDNDE